MYRRLEATLGNGDGAWLSLDDPRLLLCPNKARSLDVSTWSFNEGPSRVSKDGALNVLLLYFHIAP